MYDSVAPTSLRVVQICPNNGGGVAHFAQILAERLTERGLREITIPASQAGIAFPEGFAFDRQRDVILLHFSGYEYGHRGMCYWLVKQVRELRRSEQTLGLVTYFHELYAFGPPWRSAFWVSAFHRYFVFALQAVSDKIFTNTELHKHRLHQLSLKARPVCCLPVYSNVMEPQIRPPFRERGKYAVMFGIDENRRRALRAFGGPEGLRAFGIDEVVEIGTGQSVCPNAPGWRFLGRLDTQDVSRILLQARFGLVTHRPAELAKSGVFAAYAAHGCIPLMPEMKGTLPDGLRYGFNVLILKDRLEDRTEAELAGISANISTWYATHTSSVFADAIISEAFKSFLPALRKATVLGDAPEQVYSRVS